MVVSVLRKMFRVSEKSEESSKKGRLRRIMWSAFLLLLIAGVAAGTYWWSVRVQLVEDQIRLALHEAGLVDVDFVLIDVGLYGARLESFTLGEASQPALLVKDLELTYSLSGVLEQRLEAVEIGSVAVALKSDESGLDLGPFGSLLDGAGGDTGVGGGFETGPISIERMVASLKLSQGQIVVAGGAVVERDGDGYRLALSDRCVQVDVGDFSLGGVVLDPIATQLCSADPRGDISWPLEAGLSFRTGQVPLIVRSDLGELLLQAQFPELRGTAVLGEGIGLQVSVRSADVSLPGQALSLTGADFDVAFDDLLSLAGTWQLTSGRVSDLTGVRRFTPLRVVGDGQVTRDSTGFDLLLSDASTLSLLASVKGSHQTVNGRGSAEVTVGPLIFSPSGLQPQTLLPAFKGLIANVTGSMNATADVGWRPGRVRGDAKARLDDFGFSTETARIEGVRGDLVFDQLFPPRTADGQRLEVGSVEAGLALSDGEVIFSLDGAGGVTVEKAAWPFAGGTISLSSGVIEPGASEQEFELAVEKVDLSAFISLLALDGASGTGVISGRVPITIRDGDPIITGGVLTAGEAGHLSYKGGGTDAVAGGQGALVFQALEDFQYTGLTLSLDGNAQDRLNVRLNLEGANPGLYDGYPFAININTEASFAELLRSATLGANAIDLIRDRGANGQ